MIHVLHKRMAWRSAIGLAVFALLGIFFSEGLRASASVNPPEVLEGRALQASPVQRFFGSPISPDSFISENPVPVRPCLPVASGTPPDSSFMALVRSRDRSKVEREGVLVRAQILNKYLHFRESLTSP